MGIDQIHNRIDVLLGEFVHRTEFIGENPNSPINQKLLISITHLSLIIRANLSLN